MPVILARENYAEWLDPGMNYSSALYASSGDDFAEAARQAAIATRDTLQAAKP